MLSAAGEIAETEITSEDPEGYGFGDACVAMLNAGGAWQPALGQDRQPVEAQFSYVCRFVLRL